MWNMCSWEQYQKLHFNKPSCLHRPPLTKETKTPENKSQNRNTTDEHKTKPVKHNHIITHTLQNIEKDVVDAAHDNLNVIIQRQHELTAKLVPVTKRGFCV